jgi:probable HAF family extracellular repeat protein
MARRTIIERLLVGCAVACTAAALAPASAPAAEYTIRPITLHTEFSLATAVNARGEVTGCLADPHTHGRVVFRFSAGVIQNLGSVVEGSSCGSAINRNGVIAGTSILNEDTAQETQAGFLIRGNVAVGQPGELFGEGHAFGLNDVGEVVGVGVVFGESHAFLWSHGFSTAHAGEAVGSSDTADGFEHAFLWDGSMHDLGTLGGSFSRAFGMSHAGHVVGDAALRNGAERAFLWTPATGMRNLGNLERGQFSTALAVNGLDQVVGQAGTSSNARAFIWTERSGMRDLTGLIPVPNAWTLFEATGINSRGQIVGFGALRGRDMAFLLTPT